MSEAEQIECEACCGKGWNDKWVAIAGHFFGGETSRVECEACDGTGFEHETNPVSAGVE